MHNHSRYARSGHRRDTRKLCRHFAAVTLVLSAVCLTACGSPEASPAPSLTVILVTATANEVEPHLGPAQRADLRREALAGSASAVLALPDADLVQIPLTPRRPGGDIDYGPTREARADQQITAVESALAAATSTASRLDLLTPLNTVVGLTALNPGSAHNDLIVISSGLSTEDPVDLNSIGWSKDPTALAQDLKERHLLSDWSRWHVVFVGLGEAAGPQERLPESARQQLFAYWLSICRAAGADSCAVDQTPPPTRRPAHGEKVPPVEVPKISTTKDVDGDVSEAVVPESVLFAKGSAELLPDAENALKPIASEALQTRRRLCITGMTDSVTGLPAYNRELSWKRALAVKIVLLNLGLTKSQVPCVVGAGSSRNPPGADLTNGLPDLSKAAALRRVVIDFLP